MIVLWCGLDDFSNSDTLLTSLSIVAAIDEIAVCIGVSRHDCFHPVENSWKLLPVTSLVTPLLLGVLPARCHGVGAGSVIWPRCCFHTFSRV